MISIQFQTRNKKDHFNLLFFQKLPNFNFLNENHRDTFLNRAHFFQNFILRIFVFGKKFGRDVRSQKSGWTVAETETEVGPNP